MHQAERPQSTQRPTTSRRPGTGATVARVILLVLIALFVLGAGAQFYLAGLSIFDTPAHWSDHANLGHGLGMLPWFLWIPAALGRAGWKVIAGTVLLFVLFEAQYAFIEAGNAFVHALHPLNGALIFALAVWIAVATARLLMRDRAVATVVTPGAP